MGETMFLQVMNDKAKTLGMTNTKFVKVNGPAFTTEEDYVRFMKYITTYKSYLRTGISQ
jgi:D-alanyl-D-alanine carboxypeptidase